MNDLISREKLIKEAEESGNSYFKERVISAPTVKALTIDRLAEIMDKVLDIEPPCYHCYHLELKYDCGRKCKNPYFDDYKSCWEEFFEHYAEVEE